MDANNLMAVTTGDAGKVNHAKPRARVDDKNVQNVDFLDIVNRLSAQVFVSWQSTWDMIPAMTI